MESLRAYRTTEGPSFEVYRGIKLAGIDFITSVPCVNLQELLCLVADDTEILHIPVTREEEGAGICAGAWMGGKRPAILMQNSGLGNCINALASLNQLYHIPLLMIMSHRGSAGERIRGQIPMGRLTEPLLAAMEISCFAPEPAAAALTVVRAWRLAEERGSPAAVLLDLNFWKGEDGRRL